MSSENFADDSYLQKRLANIDDYFGKVNIAKFPTGDALKKLATHGHDKLIFSKSQIDRLTTGLKVAAWDMYGASFTKEDKERSKRMRRTADGLLKDLDELSPLRRRSFPAPKDLEAKSDVQEYVDIDRLELELSDLRSSLDEELKVRTGEIHGKAHMPKRFGKGADYLIFRRYLIAFYKVEIEKDLLPKKIPARLSRLVMFMSIGQFPDLEQKNIEAQIRYDLKVDFCEELAKVFC